MTCPPQNGPRRALFCTWKAAERPTTYEEGSTTWNRNSPIRKCGRHLDGTLMLGAGKKGMDGVLRMSAVLEVGKTHGPVTCACGMIRRPQACAREGQPEPSPQEPCKEYTPRCW